MSKIKKTINKIAPVDKQEQLIYCGPNIPGGILQKYTVYVNGIPRYLSDLLIKCPAIKSLIVPIEQFSQTEQAIKQKGTPQNMFYNQILEYFKKGGV